MSWIDTIENETVPEHACFQAAPTCVPYLSGVPADDEPETPEEAGAVAAARGGRTMTTAELRRRLSVGERLYGYGFEWLCREHVPARWERVCRRWASKH